MKALAIAASIFASPAFATGLSDQGLGDPNVMGGPADSYGFSSGDDFHGPKDGGGINFVGCPDDWPAWQHATHVGKQAAKDRSKCQTTVVVPEPERPVDLPSAVPLPAGAILLLTGLFSIWVARK